MPKLTASLHCYNSRADRAGRRYFALRFIDHATGREVTGTVSGGESNIYSSILYYRKEGDDIDGAGYNRSILWHRDEDMPIRDFDRMTKEWGHAGCSPEEIARYITNNLNS